MPNLAGTGIVGAATGCGAALNAEMSTNSMNTMLRVWHVEEVTGLGRSTIYLYVSQGKFPKPRKLGVRAVGWLSGEVFAWIAERSVAH